MEKNTPENLSDLLLAWYDVNKRSLPWREDPTPYHVWLSEIMLQQTRVEAVKGYYARFLQALPTIRALAEASEEQCLKLWEGLGYYSRVRNLHKAAVVIEEQYNGRMPSDPEEILRLPGIGTYTCAAIASIAFGKVLPAVDGNLLRVFARMTCCEDDIRTPAAIKAATAWHLSRMNACSSSLERPGDYNQALMDLGSGICLANSAPRCAACPWEGSCAAAASIRAGNTDPEDLPWPVMPPKKARRVDKKTVYLIRCGGKTAIRKRPQTGLLAGLYEFPAAEGHLGIKTSLAYLRSLGFEPLKLIPLEPARHIFTHREWLMNGYEVLTDETAAPPDPPDILLKTPEEIRENYAIPSAYSAFLRQC